MALVLDDFKLSCELFGHTLDIRAVCGVNNCIVSGSRDKTSKIWERDETGYKDSETLNDHSNYISSVCVFNNSQWIGTGSNDSTICLYLLGCVKPFAILKDHKGTVCSLSEGLEPNILISGSWDQTARIWKNLDTGSSSLELKGHDAAVWAVATLKSGKYATGSADKNIFVWNAQGQKLVVLKGHTDCVRGLASLADGSFVSCSNDATVRHWSDTYECIKEFHGHSNYIYSISLIPALGADVFVTGSEDNTIRLWSASTGALGNAITLPAQSVWSVSCTENGDIVTGSSDAVVRVFSKDSSRQASLEAISCFNVAVESRKTEQAKELGGIKVNDLPGPESLLVEGAEGQTRIVRETNGKVMCYQWANGKWECLGDVTGANSGSSEKTLYMGKEYDYVFSIDIEDGKPPLKLPFNVDQDPWPIAQQFIHKNGLPQEYLEQVANFIIKNAGLENLPASKNDPEYTDPFTGEGRYVPGSSTTPSSNNVNVNFRERGNAPISGANYDPFTGASSYSSGGKPANVIRKHIPCTKFATFDVFDSAKILDKLKEFNEKTGDSTFQVPNEVLEGVVKLVDSPNPEYVEELKKMLSWPKEIRFPVLDVIRLAVRNQETCTMLGGAEFLTCITENMLSTPPNQLMAIRTLNNMMTHGWGRGLVEIKINEICDNLSTIRSGTVNLQIALASLFLNLSISQGEMPSEEICTTLTINVIRLLGWMTDPEAIFRSYQTIGNLICFNKANILSIIKSIDSFTEHVNANKNNPLEKLMECAVELAEKL